MLPAFPSKYLPDRGIANAKLFGKRVFGNTNGLKCQNFSNHFLGEFRYNCCASFPHAIFFHRILHVVVLRACKQVDRAEARRIVAVMKRPFPFWYFANYRFKRQSGDPDFPASFWNPHESHLSRIQVSVPFHARILMPRTRKVISAHLRKLCQKVVVIANLITHLRPLLWGILPWLRCFQQWGHIHFRTAQTLVQ